MSLCAPQLLPFEASACLQDLVCCYLDSDEPLRLMRLLSWACGKLDLQNVTSDLFTGCMYLKGVWGACCWATFQSKTVSVLATIKHIGLALVLAKSAFICLLCLSWQPTSVMSPFQKGGPLHAAVPGPVAQRLAAVFIPKAAAPCCSALEQHLGGAWVCLAGPCFGCALLSLFQQPACCASTSLRHYVLSADLLHVLCHAGGSSVQLVCTPDFQSLLAFLCPLVALGGQGQGLCASLGGKSVT